MHYGILLMCHCEERSDVAISGRHCRPVQAVEETYTPIASVAALSERHAGWQHAPHGFCGMRPPSLSLRGRSAPVAISGRHFQFVQGADKNAPTDCVCSGAHCAAVGGFAALRMRRAPCG